ncbi:DUF3422 family protein [Solirhodobacter olei]|uniref:DUF3422 family protein n=1 Tax=Solirhodobacter olei TaxID=2493082 RepID=UPI000FDA447D|nr:DUF3422 domain-containing protein [Solirhodobacter olei]
MSAAFDHPLRYTITNELHARPFPAIQAPAHAVFLALKQPVGAANRDRAKDLVHLQALLDRHGAPRPEPGATHYAGAIGRQELKWESHTEVVTFTAFGPGVGPRPFDPAAAEVFPEDWIAQAPGKRLVSALIRIDFLPEDPAALGAMFDEWFVAESLACAWVLDRAAVVASDFRIDPAGHMRFALLVRPGTSPQRIGRIVQRLCEIETYKAMSMLGLGRARTLAGRLNEVEPQLSALVEELTSDTGSPEHTLHELLAISAELEKLAAQASFRFGATGAYEAIVQQRVAVLREERFEGRQTLGEFMTRRYDPAMRTVKSAERQLNQMSARAERAGDLLRTRVDVDRSRQSQQLLESMDRRADLQLRLQHTVEGLSVVAISYYAVNLLSYIAAPFADHWGVAHMAVAAALTPLVVVVMWLGLRRVRKGLH